MKNILLLLLIVVTPALTFGDIYSLQYKITLINKPGTEELDWLRKEMLIDNNDATLIEYTNDLYNNGNSFQFTLNIDLRVDGSQFKSFNVNNFFPPYTNSQYYSDTSYPSRFNYHFDGNTLYRIHSTLKDDKSGLRDVSSDIEALSLQEIIKSKLSLRQLEFIIRPYLLLNKYTENAMGELENKPKILTVGDSVKFKYGDSDKGLEYSFKKENDDYILNAIAIHWPHLTEEYVLEDYSIIDSEILESNSQAIKDHASQLNK